jgi:hypothetical protein
LGGGKENREGEQEKEREREREEECECHLNRFPRVGITSLGCHLTENALTG